MAVHDNSYGTAEDVRALTRVYLAGQSTFNATTRPTLVEVEGFIDQCSGVLNLALAAHGVGTPVTSQVAYQACRNWVVTYAAALVELAQPTAAYGDESNPRAILLARLSETANAWVEANAGAFGALGESQPASDSNALIFTGQTVQADRADPDDTSLEQPLFTRRQFDTT